jgi:multiple sugar transport system permease protein
MAVTVAAGRLPVEHKRRRRTDSRFAGVFLAPSVLGLAAFTLFPTVMALAMSLFDWPVFGERSFLGVVNYQHLVSDPLFRRVILNTCLFVLLYVPLNLVVSLGLAVWVSPKIKGRNAYRVLFFIPVMAPMVANAMVWRLLFQPGGFLDGIWPGGAPNFLASTAWAMPAVVAMSVWQGFGYNFLVFSAALDQVPASQLESAEIDGASAFQRFFHVTLPMITPSIFFATTMTLITSFQVFAQPFILTQGGPGVTTQTIVMYVYDQGWQFLNMGLASAAGWVLFVIIMAITAVQFVGQKRWVHYDA